MLAAINATAAPAPIGNRRDCGLAPIFLFDLNGIDRVAMRRVRNATGRNRAMTPDPVLGPVRSSGLTCGDTKIAAAVAPRPARRGRQRIKAAMRRSRLLNSVSNLRTKILFA